MASSETGALVKAELHTLGISTPAQVKAFIKLPRRAATIQTALKAIAGQRKKQYQSLRRIKSDARRLSKEKKL